MRANGIRSVLAILLYAPSPAAAIDLTGVWVQTRDFSCTSYSEGATAKESLSIPSISVQHDGVAILAGGGVVSAEGVVVADSKDVGHGLFRTCAAVPYVDTFRLRSAKTFPEKPDGVSGKMVVELLYYNADLAVHKVCKKGVFERTSTQTPLLDPCP
jgi:hypothetical protein